ncbi:L-lactate dehydrogenase complex protein LldG [Algoriphagus boseongensis]|uniref:L-lactate dehydrogenase complex protein LldG n=1 Tax=Algoriphagus boseongensis TaxID=1442587 RepID=A0A4R6T5R9_9BACT|nr:LUD domain-containing protein [Algoriphagus boseongensis]TDQ15106.1 L-lactate dehydrogenase complex protein LldG [Algoriphagus boseongensis]
MSSRKSILEAIKAIPREEKPLPDLPDFGISGELEEGFTQSILGNKGEVLEKSVFENWLATQDFSKILSLTESYRNLSTIELPKDPHELSTLDLAILEGQFGVAENGAIWLDDSQLFLRAIPFITEHLVIVLDRKNLVPTLHQAYQRIGDAHSGFGLFVAGPSKTADIEQSLVIGAHGAKSLRVVWK